MSVYITIRNCLAGLQNLGFATKDWNCIADRIAMQKFDKETLCIFKESIENIRDFLTVDKLCAVLLKSDQLLAAIK